MNGDEMVSSLMFTTLGAGVLFGVVSLVWFLRKRGNRDVYKRATGIDESRGQAMSRDLAQRPPTARTTWFQTSRTELR